MLVVDEDLRAFQSSIRQFLSDRYANGHIRTLIKGASGFDQDEWKVFAELGALSLLAPDRLGGGCLSGNEYFDASVVAYELGKVLYDGPFLISSLATKCLGEASSGSFDGIVEELMQGNVIITWACEDENAHTPTLLNSQSQLIGGKKLVEFAEESQGSIVTTFLDGKTSSCFVPLPSPGVKVRTQRSLDPVKRFGKIEFKNVNIDAEHLVGDHSSTLKLQALGVLLQSAETLGAAERVFDFTIDWVNDRMAFGRPIGSYQALKHRLAEHKLWLESARGLVEGLATGLHENNDVQQLVSAMKAFIGQGSVALIQDSVQMHGGIGVTWEHDLHLYLRRISSNRVQFGSPAFHLEQLCELMGV